MAGGFRPSRRQFLAFAGAALAPHAIAAPRGAFVKDTAVLAGDLFARYPYFDAVSRRRFREKYAAMAPRIGAVTAAEQFLPLLEELLAALQDDNVTVVERPVRRRGLLARLRGR